MKVIQIFGAVAALSVIAVASAQGSELSCTDSDFAKSEFVAELRKVEGNVLVSDAVGMTSGVENQPLKNNMRVTTTSRASVTVSYRCGCDVNLKENERVDIAAPNTCAALIAAVQSVPVGVALGAVAPAVGLTTGTGALIATTVGVGAFILFRRDRNVSPN